MRLEQLEYILEIAKTNSINIASRNLYVSQPALSKAIKQLEQELGIDLLTRTVEGVKLTENGKAVLPIIKDVLNKVDELQGLSTELRNEKNRSIKTQFTIYTVPIILDTFLYVALKKMKELFPLTNITTQLVASAEIKDMPVSDFNDILLLVNMNKNMDDTIEHLGLSHERLFEEKLSIIVSKNSPLATKKIISIEQVLNYEQIFPYNRFDQEKNYMKFANRKEPIKTLMKTNNLRVIKNELLANKNAVYITYKMLVKKDFSNNENFLSIPIKNVECQFFCLYNDKNANLPIFSELFKALRNARDDM